MDSSHVGVAKVFLLNIILEPKYEMLYYNQSIKFNFALSGTILAEKPLL
jgi:hypothetical protein